jgi:hypothetical protein
MNQLVLFDVLSIVIKLIVALELEFDPLVDGVETFDQFDVELHFLKKNMWQEVVEVIIPFL